MKASKSVQGACDGHELVFTNLFPDSQAFVFPCDATGRVDMDLLSESARFRYLYARVVFRNLLETPVVRKPESTCASCNP